MTLSLPLFAWWIAGTVALTAYVAYLRGKLTVSNVFWIAAIWWVLAPWIIAFHVLFVAMLWLADNRVFKFVLYEKQRQKAKRESGETNNWG